MGEIMNSLVSIIIPAYNVEKYVEKCVLSALNQSYENIEVIVVNDGSTDNTLDILNKIPESDKLKIITKNNGGVSVARNTGIESAHGDYVVFVDGDDYIASDFVEYMLSLAINTKCDFCLSTDCYSKKDDIQSQPLHEEVLSSEDAVALLISPRVIVGCWNKIYSMSFIKKHNLRFSTELFYGEGLNFIIQCAQKAENIGVGNKKVYYYRRNNMGSATTRFNIDKYRNGEKSLDIIKSSIIVTSKKIEEMYILHKSLFSLGAMVNIIQHECKKKYRSDYLRYRKYLKKHLMFIWRSKKISLYRKLLLLGGLMFPGLIARMDDKRRKKIEENSI